MDLAFYPLMQIRLRHDYFTDGNCPEVEIVPSPATARLLQEMEIRSVRRDYGVELFYGERDGQPSPLVEIAEILRLSFWLRPTTPLFHNYTAHVPVDGPAALFYTTNHGQGATEAATYPQGPETLVSLATAPFQLKINGSPDDIIIIDENGYVPAEGLIKVHPADENEPPTKATVNIANLQAGQYLVINGDDTIVFLAGADGQQPGDFGLLSLYLGDTGEGDRSIIAADGTIEPIALTLTFGARSTIWRYNLISRNNEFQDFSIRSEGDTQEFIAPPQAIRVLPNHTEAAVLVSASPIPLRANPPERFWLSFTDQNGRVHADALLLPNAGAESISRDGPGSTPLYSDLYVYL